jgi:hypothetical protein
MVRPVRSEAREVYAELASVIVAPHARFPARDLCAWWNVIPAVWAVIDGVENQPLVRSVGAEVRLVEEPIGNGETRLKVA